MRPCSAAAQARARSSVNTARGPIVDLDALGAALQAGTIAGAGLDVLPQRAGRPDHPLIEAWRRREAWLDGSLVADAACRLLQPGIYARSPAEIDGGGGHLICATGG